MDWRAKRILPTNLPPHGQPSFPEPLTISNLQKQGWIWVPCNAPKSRAPFHNLLIIKGPTKEVLAVGWKTWPPPETGTGREWTEDTEKKGGPRVRTGTSPVSLGPPHQGRRRPTLPPLRAVPSAMAGLTSLFGMGRGGTPPPLPPLFVTGERFTVAPAYAAGKRHFEAPERNLRAISTGRLCRRRLCTSRLSTW